MSGSKSVNRLFLAVTALYIGVSLGIGFLSPFLPFLAGMSNYTSILLSQALVFVPAFLY